MLEDFTHQDMHCTVVSQLAQDALAFQIPWLVLVL